MRVLKSVNLYLEYVPRCFRNQMQKKVEHKLTSRKITDTQTHSGLKSGEIVHHYLSVKVNKNDGT